MKNSEAYYLGLDIGTDSIGYAVTDTQYAIKKFGGEPMWGATLFDAANTSAERRLYRTGRRRIDRRQQRIRLLEDLFAAEIARVDPKFFIRRKCSALFREDAPYGVQLFSGEGLSDAAYHERYPTIHHLIVDLMSSDTAHNVRLVYVACAWLLANRGHFLFDIAPENIQEITDFPKVYESFCTFLQEQDYTLPWSSDIAATRIEDVLRAECGVKKKSELLKAELFGSNKISKEPTDSFPFNTADVISLLAGGKVKPAAVFCNEAYAGIDAVSLTMNDDDFTRIVSELGEDGEFLEQLRKIVNCTQLNAAMRGCSSISEAKMQIYEQHKRDLQYLKQFVRKYCKEKYNEIFRDAVQDNYLCYSHNIKSLRGVDSSKLKFCGKDAFCDFLTKRVKGISVSDTDKPAYEDMMLRLQLRTFLPKQKDADNRVIPQQLYRYELKAILDNAQTYLPMLREKDADGISVYDKVLSIFDFRVPYFVGPLKDGSKNAWIVRKAEGTILPWNFADKVDLDKSEKAFIARMTNRCTYLPDEDVLPEGSLLYSRFCVLNELNNLKINGTPIPVNIKQELYTELFEKRARVTVRQIQAYLVRRGCMDDKDTLSGLDESVKSGLKSYHVFRRLLTDGALSEDEVESIIQHMAYSEDKTRMRKWLCAHYPALQDSDISYILHQNFKGFGRLSKRFLTGIYGTVQGSDGEASNIIELLWSTNENLMQLLSGRYTFSDTIREISRTYYAAHPKSLDERLNEMYVSNAVKRPIFRTLDIVQDVVKATGRPPEKIFIEMARGSTAEQKGKRTESRKNQLLALYKKIKTDDARRLTEELESMGAMADNRLQDRRLFLYYLQMGKCAYTGRTIELNRLSDGTYNLDHIYPQCFVKDDSLLNNLVLVDSKENGRKTDTYPVSADIRSKMQSYWLYLKNNGLMTDEKYRRLTRKTPFSNDEKLRFINRQLVETRQSTKTVAALLQERFPDAEIIYVKAGMVSEFRQEFDMPKCRSVNDLHHAKDAYLNIVVGNVYHERFTSKWFSLESGYNVQVKKLFEKRQEYAGNCYWRGGEDLALVRKMMGKNAVRLTKYAFCRKGGLFDQQPVKKKAGLIPLKAGLPTEKYGGYNKPTASFFVLTRFAVKKGHEVMFVPINLMDAGQFTADAGYAKRRTAEMIESITGTRPQELELLLNGRILKINTVISLDGTRMTLSGKSNGGQKIIVSMLDAMILGNSQERYIKSMQSFLDKRKTNPSILPDEQHDGLSAERNLALYDILTKKLVSWPFCKMPGNQGTLLSQDKARGIFQSADIITQINCLLSITQLLAGKVNTCDLTAAGGASHAGATALSSKLSNWAKTYTDVRIIDGSPAGLFSTQSGNLLELL